MEMRRWFETEHFYDRVAHRLEAFTPEQRLRLRPTVEQPNPEDIFTEVAITELHRSDVVLDIGTGDARWLRDNIAPRVSLAIGLDYGGVRLHEALVAIHSGASRVELVLADARSLPLLDNSVSVVLSRRGPFGDPADPRFFTEGLRVLRPAGRVFEIGIGELNAREVSEVFGSSQMSEYEHGGPIIERRVAKLTAAGLKPDRVQDLRTYEYFPSRGALEFRLLTTPVLEAFDPEVHAREVDELVRRHATEHGIRLTFHRTIIAATNVGGA